MNRTLNVVRMQFVNRQTYLWIPLIVLAGSFALSLLVYAMIPGEAPKYGGGSQAPLWYFLVVGVQSLTLTFPFSQAMSVTRREFYLGTLLAAAATSAMLSVVLVAGGLLERATGGWGMNGYFFYLDWIWEGGPGAALVVYFVMAMMFFLVGFWGATIYKRLGGVGLTIVLVAIGLAFVGLMWLIGRAEAWVQVFQGIAELGALGLSLWAVVVGAVLAAISYLTLRRAIP